MLVKNEYFNLISALTNDHNRGTIIWLCNIGAEKFWHKTAKSITDKNEDIIVNRIEELNLLLCRKQDVLILQRYPSPEYLSFMQNLGFSIPTILTPKDKDPFVTISEKVLKDELLLKELTDIARNNDETYFVPYAVTKLEEQIARICKVKIIGASSEISAKVNDKIYNRKIAERLNLPVSEGKICHTIQEIQDVYSDLIKSPSGFKKIVIKEPYGVSGNGLYIVEDEKRLKANTFRLSRFTGNEPDRQWLVEGWYEKSFDINYQLYIADNGYSGMFSLKQQLLDDTIYIGSRFPVMLEKGIVDKYQEFGAVIGQHLYDMGYKGIASIDSIITKEGTIFPIIEINGRFSLSTYCSFLSRILGDVKILFRYFRIITKHPVDYVTFCDILNEAGILYKKGSGEGIIICNSGTLPNRYADESELCFGRLFIIIVSDTWEKSDYISQKMDELVKKLMK